MSINECIFCKKEAHGVHHLLFGSNRRLADEDGLYYPICDSCHIAGKYRIHDNPTAERLSKMLGQALWELKEAGGNDEIRNKFIKRYGRNYL